VPSWINPREVGIDDSIKEMRLAFSAALDGLGIVLGRRGWGISGAGSLGDWRPSRQATCCRDPKAGDTING
jgi:hypothetical protein